MIHSLIPEIIVGFQTNQAHQFQTISTTSSKQLYYKLTHIYIVFDLPTQFFLTLSSSSFLRAESTNLQPYLASS